MKRWTPLGGAVVAAVSVVLAVGVLELGARVWVRLTWPESRIRLLTTRVERAGRYIYDANLGYRLAPNLDRPDGTYVVRHNALGFRGPPLASPGDSERRRVVLMGASTVYGIFVDDDSTSAVLLEQELGRRYPDLEVEVINAGVPGWTSRETLRNLTDHILPLAPDVVVMVDGRNEIFPEVFNGYRPDYEHYRETGYDFRDANRRYRRLFRLSRLAMLIVARDRGHFGFSFRRADPTYGNIRFDNKPTDAELVRNARRPGVTEGYRRNLERFMTRVRTAGASPVVSTIPFLAERFGTGVLDLRDRARVIPVLDTLVMTNNRLVRTVAAELRAPLVDAAALGRDEYLRDDCHFLPAGEQAFAVLLADAVGPLLIAERRDAQPVPSR